MHRKGFTIVELLVVVSIIGILLGIVSVAVTGSIKNTRSRRADAMRAAFQQAIAMYYSQEGEWPGAAENRTKNMGDKSTYTFTATETDAILREIVEKSTGKNASRPLIDASALFVARASAVKGDGCFDDHGPSSVCGGKNCINGSDFQRALAGGLKTSEMTFGWQGKEYGKFRRFWLTYNAKTDTITVSKEKPSK